MSTRLAVIALLVTGLALEVASVAVPHPAYAHAYLLECSPVDGQVLVAAPAAGQAPLQRVGEPRPAVDPAARRDREEVWPSALRTTRTARPTRRGRRSPPAWPREPTSWPGGSRPRTRTWCRARSVSASAIRARWPSRGAGRRPCRSHRRRGRPWPGLSRRGPRARRRAVRRRALARRGRADRRGRRIAWSGFAALTAGTVVVLAQGPYAGGTCSPGCSTRTSCADPGHAAGPGAAGAAGDRPRARRPPRDRRPAEEPRHPDEDAGSCPRGGVPSPWC